MYKKQGQGAEATTEAAKKGKNAGLHSGATAAAAVHGGGGGAPGKREARAGDHGVMPTAMEREEGQRLVEEESVRVRAAEEALVTSKHVFWCHVTPKTKIYIGVT